MLIDCDARGEKRCHKSWQCTPAQEEEEEEEEEQNKIGRILFK